MKRKVKTFILSNILLGGIGNYFSVSVLNAFTVLKSGGRISAQVLNIFPYLIAHSSDEVLHKALLVTNLAVILASVYFAFLYESPGRILKTKERRITDKISIPYPAGNGQYGNSDFMDYAELDSTKELSCYTYNPSRPKPPKRGGVVIGIRAIGSVPAKKKIEKIMYLSEDRHALMVGATRSGKSRRVFLQSIWLTMMAGENMVVTDPKGELRAYTSPFAEQMEYLQVVIDFREPNKGSHHNYMLEILSAIDKGDTAEAIDLTWDLVAVLVGEAKGEPIWHNGECAAIAAVILIVAMEAPREYRNLTNVYYFLFNMAKPDAFGEMPLTRYLEGLDETHPARAVFAMAEIAHVKTRGSFFSSALGTLRHFTNPKIAEMTSSTDYTFEEMATKKTIVYIILPDEKATLYSLGSMYIMQHYIYNVKAAQQNGGRCPIDWWYFLDEFGQLPYIPPIPQFLTVGAGRGMRFVLGCQDLQQISKKYKDDYNTIKNNCELWIYLKCSIPETQEEFSKRCGKYTVQVNSTNHSTNKSAGSESHGSSLTGRDLLMPGEVGRVDYPYSLNCFAGKNPLMLITPDLSYYHANKVLGMGDEEHNKKLIVERNQARNARYIPKISLWGIWNEYKVMDEYPEDDDYSYEESDERISFLD